MAFLFGGLLWAILVGVGLFGCHLGFGEIEAFWVFLTMIVSFFLSVFITTVIDGELILDGGIKFKHVAMLLGFVIAILFILLLVKALLA